MATKMKKGLLFQGLLVVLCSLALALVAGCGSSGGGGDGLVDGGPGGGGDPIVEPPGGTTFAVVDDSYTWLGNTALTVPAASGVLANDVATNGTATFVTTNTQGTVDTTGLTGGSFTYTPPTGAILPFTDTFAYTATDGTDQQSGTVTITINQEAWFVKNDFTGTSDGSATAPFTTLAAASTASGAGDIIFVFAGNGTNAGQNVGIDLLTDQRLIGEGVGLTFDVQPNGTPLAVPLVAIPAGAVAPVISDTVNIVDNIPIVSLANGVEVAGIIVDGTGIQVNTNMNGISAPLPTTSITGFNIHDNTIRNVPRAGVQLGAASGGTGLIMNNTLTNLTGPNPDNAIDIVTTAANVDFTIAGNTLNTVSETGIRVAFPSGTVAATGNILTDVGSAVNGRGIDIDGAGTTTISGNSVDNTGVVAVSRAGIQLNATGTLAASVTGNTALNTDGIGGEGGIQAQVSDAASSLCLRMTGNTTDSGFVLDNTNGAPAAGFRIEGPLQADFEAANTGTVTYLLNVGAFTFVPVGTCGFAP